jgi:hypothetical protein
MPSNQQIAGWLQEAAENARILAPHWDGSSDNEKKRWDKRASLVEQMRCETCRWWMCTLTKYNTLGRPLVECAKTTIKGENEQFCCCHWEEKKWTK